ncbi:hypothetical protein [Herpetosiphon giganteus]|nr:hypothetical protein [Herpetosiphon giganteus]MBM7845608.1 hypothetical protein [Herpetosiphon giganteus]
MLKHGLHNPLLALQKRSISRIALPEIRFPQIGKGSIHVQRDPKAFRC